MAIEKLATVWAFLLGLVACATPYQPLGWRGGYIETQRAPRQFEVAFYGNGHTGLEAAEEYVLLRAAQLTLERGYAYFTVAEKMSFLWDQVVRSPEGTYTVVSGRIKGGTFRGMSETYTTGGLYVTTISRPDARLYIECYAEPPTAAGNYFDARAVYGQTRQK